MQSQALAVREQYGVLMEEYAGLGEERRLVQETTADGGDERDLRGEQLGMLRTGHVTAEQHGPL